MQLGFGFPTTAPPRHDKPFLRLVVDNTRPDAQQLQLPLQQRERSADFLTARALFSLDYGVFDFLRTAPLAASAALHLQRRGVVLVGELTQLSRYQLRCLLGKYAHAESEIERALAAAGLGLSKHYPQWHRSAPRSRRRRGW